jgi:hypothetical protein
MKYFCWIVASEDGKKGTVAGNLWQNAHTYKYVYVSHHVIVITSQSVSKFGRTAKIASTTLSCFDITTSCHHISYYSLNSSSLLETTAFDTCGHHAANHANFPWEVELRCRHLHISRGMPAVVRQPRNVSTHFIERSLKLMIHRPGRF